VNDDVHKCGLDCRRPIVMTNGQDAFLEPDPVPWHRLDPEEVEGLTHDVISFVEEQLASESEKLAALLAAAYAQKHFMLEHSPEFAKAAAEIEEYHRQTLAIVRAHLTP
jgi:hypothetical protein